MQTLMIFWSSWLLEMVVSERQQPAGTSSVAIPPGTAFGSHCHMAGWGSGAHGPGRTTRVVGRPAHGANCPQLRLSGCPGLPCPNACVMAYPKLNSFGLWACFDPIEPKSCYVSGLHLLPWFVECVSLLLWCVFSLNSPAYKYLPTLVEMVSIRLLPLGWCLYFVY